MSNSELEDKKIIKALRAELEDANKQIRELKLDLAAKSMENGGHTKEQFWKLVVRHENDLLNFDQEKSQMIKRETELIEQLNTLKAEIEARGDFQYKIPPPDPTLVVQHKYEVLSLSYEKLEQENAKLKKDLEEANTKLEEIDKKVTQEVVDVEVIKEALEIIKNKKKYPLENYYNQFKIKGVEENANFNVVRCSLYFDNKMSKDKGNPKQHNIFEFLGVSRRGSCQKSYVKNRKVSPLAASGLLDGSKCEGRSSFVKNIPTKPERG